MAGSSATRFFRVGSDNFGTGGRVIALNPAAFGGRGMAPQPERQDYGREGESVSNTLPVPAGTWMVKTHGKTIVQSSDMKSFGVKPFCVEDAAGGPLKGGSRSVPPVVKNGTVPPDFPATGGQAVVAAIEVRP
ncbi:hypothetical protein LWE61_17270 [Sphingobium sufflavum]|uniref:hypothetical protein n=1 Tax=Sphingobium sufflavum TaxID=1129547 RepID=UPI001F2036BE|nr:hypothetical protein [Sphingobium sufflavum]MCE7798290.1 hypothetical protein [Sphingobium sufflavum]